MGDRKDIDYVAGEPRDVLVQAVLRFQLGPEVDGLSKAEAWLPPDLMTPFTRALYRIEAELLIADAETFTAEVGETRTQEERRHDALMTMLQRILED